MIHQRHYNGDTDYDIGGT